MNIKNSFGFIDIRRQRPQDRDKPRKKRVKDIASVGWICGCKRYNNEKPDEKGNLKCARCYIVKNVKDIVV
jgi:hypothetical protein